MKKVILLTALCLGACQLRFEPVMMLCAESEDKKELCATGFFVNETDMATAAHLLHQNKSGEIKIKGEGIDKVTANIYRGYEDRDILIIRIPEAKVEDHFVLCEDVKQAPVLHGGRRNAYEFPEWVGARLLGSRGITFRTDMQVPHGFSGGPVLDVDRGCVVGLNSWVGDNFTIGAVLLQEDLI